MHGSTQLFPGQRADEEIVIFTRRHWIQLAIAILSVVALVAAYFAALIVIFAISDLRFRGVGGLVVSTITGVVLLMAWLFLYIKFIDYYLDVWILTSERIVQIKQRSLFNRQITELDLSTVQDVQSKVKGVVSTFLGYGTIFVQTAGTTELFEFKYIPKPLEAEKKILDYQAGLEERTKREIGEYAAMAKENPQAASTAPVALGNRHMRELKRRFPDID
jgi:hypothetical protein